MQHHKTLDVERDNHEGYDNPLREYSLALGHILCDTFDYHQDIVEQTHWILIVIQHLCHAQLFLDKILVTYNTYKDKY